MRLALLALALTCSGCGSLIAVRKADGLHIQKRCHTEPLTWMFVDGSTFTNTITICDAITSKAVN